MFGKRITVYEHQLAIHTRDGVIVGTKPAGSHRLGKRDKLWILPRSLQLLYMHGQEGTTTDGATIRTTISAWWEIEDVLFYAKSGGMKEATPTTSWLESPPVGNAASPDDLLRQRAMVWVREWVSSRKMAEALEGRNQIAVEMLPILQEIGKKYGMSVQEVQLIDFNLTGGLKGAYADLLKAEIEGQAALQRARNEAATMRSLANTARLLKDHPGLLELRVLMSQQKPRITVNLGNPASPSNDSES